MNSILQGNNRQPPETNFITTFASSSRGNKVNLKKILESTEKFPESLKAYAFLSQYLDIVEKVPKKAKLGKSRENLHFEPL